MSRINIIRTVVLLLIVCASYASQAQFNNGSKMEFGKNRVQYKENFWSFYQYKRFDVYFYTNGKEIALYSALKADNYIKDIEKYFDYELTDKLEIIIFNTLNDLKQSNIGLETETDYNTGSITHIIGNKIFVYYDGDHTHLEQMIKASVAKLILDKIIFGESIAKQVKNTIAINFPEWFTGGMASYVSYDWNTEINTKVKDAILHNRYKKFNRLTGEDAIIAGHSLWKYIANQYGESAIPNIVYLSKLSKSVDGGFLFVTGLSFKTIQKNWIAYYDSVYKTPGTDQLDLNFSPLVKKPRKKVFSEVKLSADGKYLAYVTNYMGKYKVWLYDFQTKKRKKLLVQECKLEQKVDYSYPLLGWNPQRNVLTIIRERKGQIMLRNYTVEDKSKEEYDLFYFSKVLNFNYSNSGNKLVISGVQNGQTDLYIYSFTGHTYDRLTNDINDDADPCFFNNDKQIVFSSKRINDTLNPKIKSDRMPRDYDLFLYNYQDKSPILRRITNTPTENEVRPIAFDNTHLIYLSDWNLVQNRYLVKLDSSISFIDTATHYRYSSSTFPVTNYKNSILENDLNISSNKLVSLFLRDNKYVISVDSLPAISTLKPVLLSPTVLPKKKIVDAPEDTFLNREEVKKEEPKKVEPIKEEPIIKPKKHLRVVFYNEDDTIVKKDAIIIKDTISKSHEIKPLIKDTISKRDTISKSIPKDTIIQSLIKPIDKPQVATIDTANRAGTTAIISTEVKQRNYNIIFWQDLLVAQLDNNFLNPTYQPFTGGAPYYNPGINGFFKLGTKDLMEDYKIVGGFKIGLDLNSKEYFIYVENLKKRLDKRLMFYRQSLLGVDENGGMLRSQSNELTYKLTWPLSQVAAVKGTFIGRYDRLVTLATDEASLKAPNAGNYWGGFLGEYVFDNTRNLGINAMLGTRLKVFGEWHRQLDKANTNLYSVGIDVRHYIRIHREFILATRFASAHSFGDKEIIYYMGGVDNWQNLGKSQFNSSTPIDYSQNYAYQTLATNMRGFIQNARNGNNFAVVNTELRFPLFKYIFNRPLKSDFLTNLQLIGFGDIGSAWTGNDINSKFNTERRNVVYPVANTYSPVTITLIQKINPIIAGTGFGVRSRLLGYFVRADWAWGYENGDFNSGVFYLSFAKDF